MTDEHDRIDWQRAVVRAEEAMPTAFAHLAALHYAKALCKHPRFADRLFDPHDQEFAARSPDIMLANWHKIIKECEKDGILGACMLLNSELDEACVPYVKGDKSACVEELYDAVAVLMRMIAVVEGKQTLGGKEAGE